MRWPLIKSPGSVENKKKLGYRISITSPSLLCLVFLLRLIDSYLILMPFKRCFCCIHIVQAAPCLQAQPRRALG